MADLSIMGRVAQNKKNLKKTDLYKPSKNVPVQRYERSEKDTAEWKQIDEDLKSGKRKFRKAEFSEVKF